MTGDGKRILLLNLKQRGQFAFIAPTHSVELSQEDACVQPAPGKVLFNCSGSAGSFPMENYAASDNSGLVSDTNFPTITKARYLLSGRIFETESTGGNAIVDLPLATDATGLLYAAHSGSDEALEHMTVSLPSLKVINQLCSKANIKGITLNIPKLSVIYGDSFAESALQTIDLGIVPELTDGSRLFAEARHLRSIHADFPSLSKAGLMFMNCCSFDISLEPLPINFSQITEATGCFEGTCCSGPFMLDAPVLPYANSLFKGITGIGNATAIHINLPIAEGAEYLLADSTNITELMVNGPKLINISRLAMNAKGLTHVRGNFDSALFADCSFSNCSDLTSVEAGFPSLMSGFEMFYNCGLGADAINSILETLPAHEDENDYYIDFRGCPGAAACDQSIASSKGWTVLV